MKRRARQFLGTQAERKPRSCLHASIRTIDAERICEEQSMSSHQNSAYNGEPFFQMGRAVSSTHYVRDVRPLRPALHPGVRIGRPPEQIWGQ